MRERLSLTPIVGGKVWNKGFWKETGKDLLHGDDDDDDDDLIHDDSDDDDFDLLHGPVGSNQLHPLSLEGQQPFSAAWIKININVVQQAKENK